MWLTLLAPPLALVAWLAGHPALPAVALGAVAAPFVFARLMRTLRGERTRARHRWMLALGLGAVLLPVVVGGALLALVLPIGTRALGLGALASWIVLALHARHRAERIDDVSLELALPGLARAVRLVQLSDVHVGSRDGAFLERVVEQARAHAPELVVITGDLLDESRVGVTDLAALARFECPVYLAIGNHERYVDLDAALAAIRRHGVRVLRDEAVEHGPLRLIGIDDRDRPDALPGVLERLGSDPASVDVLLYHRPDGWQAARARRIPLTLSGHTHGGQIWPFGLLVRRQYPDMIGRFERDGTTLYVSSGTGTWGPALRLGTRSEMTVIDLVPATTGGATANGVTVEAATVDGTARRTGE